MKAKYYYLIHLLILVLITTLLYAQVIWYDYVWDDFTLFIHNTSLSDQNYSWNLISRPVIEGSAYFRPLVFYSWYLEFNIFGQSAKVSHLINIIIFSLNAWLTFLLANKFLKKYNYFLPTLVLVYYILNPLLIESTVWISGRFDLLVTFFILSALNIYFLESLNKFFKDSLVSLLFFLALFSKELAIIFPLLLFFLWAYNNSLYINNLKGHFEFLRENKFLISSILFYVFVYFFLRYNALGVIGSTTQNDSSYDFLIYDLVPLQAIFFYVKNYIFPFFYVLPVHPIEWDLNYIEKIKLIFILFSLILFFLYLIVKKKNELWLCLSVALTVLLVLYIIPFNNGSSIGNMRFMTLGLSFYSIFLVKSIYDIYLVLNNKFNVKTALIITVGGYLLLLSAMVQNFNQSSKVWQNEYFLWKVSYLANPDYSINKFNYIKTLVEMGLFEEAKNILQKNNINMSPDEQALYALVLVNLDDEEGVLYYEGLVESLPKYHENYNSLRDINTLKIYSQTKLTAQNLSSVYSSYAMSVLMFNNNHEKAVKYYNISDWYHNSELSNRNYQVDFIMDYIVFNKKDAVYNFINKTKFGLSFNDRRKVKNFMDKYCYRYHSEKICKKWEIDKIKI